MDTSTQVDKIILALIGIQSDLKPVVKNAENPYFKSKYATLEAVWQEVLPLLQKYNCCVVQCGGSEDGNPVLFSTLFHSSGQFVRGSYPLASAVSNSNPQAIGSAVSYARRYSLCALLGVVTEDDDANGAAQSQQKTSISNDEYQMPFGKGLEGKRFKEVDSKFLGSFISWLEKQPKTDAKGVEFIKRAREYLSSISDEDGFGRFTDTRLR